MSLHTDIGWCDSSVNLEMGCDGCEIERWCYAKLLTDRHAGRPGWPVAFDQPRLFPERLAQALRWRDLTGTRRPDKPWLDGFPRLIFLDDMGDTFTESLPLDWLAPHLAAIAASSHHWLLLTKRPARLARFARQYALPPNVWAGTSVTSAATVGRIADLVDVPAARRYLSIEPLWGALPRLPLTGIDGVIVGGHSGLGWREHEMDLDACRSICERVVAAGIPLFVKQDSGLRPGQQGRLPDDLWCHKAMPALPHPIRWTPIS